MRKAVVTQEIFMLGDSDEPKYAIQVDLGDLRGPEGNAYAILGRVSAAIKKQVSAEAAELYSDEAKQGDYINLLRVTGNTVMAFTSGIPESILEELEA